MTNGDRIRQMGNEELAEVIRGCNKCIYENECKANGKFSCTQGIKAYLDMEVEE